MQTQNLLDIKHSVLLFIEWTKNYISRAGCFNLIVLWFSENVASDQGLHYLLKVFSVV